MTSDLTDEDYGISVASSITTVTNTINRSGALIVLRDGFTDVMRTYMDSSGEFSFIVPDGSVADRMTVFLYPSNMPAIGTYRNQLDFSSDTSLEYSNAYLYTRYETTNVAAEASTTVLTPYMQQNSGDCYLDFVVDVTGRLTYYAYDFRFDEVPAGGAVGGTLSVSFSRSSAEADVTAGTVVSDSEYQSDVSSSLSDISSSVDSMTEDLSSAAESLEYISTSQNLIIQGIDNVIMHISDQLYAFWDQLYNLIHEPTYAKLEEILGALRAIANNSDIYQVVEEIRASNNKVIANDNKLSADQAAADKANTEQIDNAIEEHGNFIIDGLKSLFIPSDDYFSSLFDDLNGFFKERFGFLYTPIDLLVRFIDLIYGSSAEFTGIPFPELKWDGYVLLEAQTVGFDILEIEEFKNVQNILYFLTNLAMIGALIALIYKKFEEVMRN